MTMPMPVQCASCIHFHRDNFQDNTCNAFPAGIPPQIFKGEHDHRLPYAGDKGIRYQPAPLEAGR
jgi:hypothetical protein